jgi:hypothetical protein
MSTIVQTLQERGARYGEFEHHAKIAQGIQDAMREQPGWEKLAPDQKQALTVIADKIARMLNGDPTYIDNWHDIVGYATLVEQRMQRDSVKVNGAANDNAPPSIFETHGGGWTAYERGRGALNIIPGGPLDILFMDGGCWLNRTDSIEALKGVVGYRKARRANHATGSEIPSTTLCGYCAGEGFRSCGKIKGCPYRA